MKQKYSEKKHIFFFLMLLLSAFYLNFLHAQTKTDLSVLDPDWVAVPGGNVLSQPERTSYGYVFICEGKMICALTQSGKVLWRKSFAEKLKPFITRTFSDLLYIVTKDSKISLLNPSGLVLWTSDANFNITEKPLKGKDGRVFVRGNSKIACFGINGKKKWLLKTESQNTSIPLVEMNDGSFLAFLSKSNGGKSLARRISPFGKEIEEITFAGNVLEALSCRDGVLLSFSDGSIGLCKAEKEGAVSQWVVKPESEGQIFLTNKGMAEGQALCLKGNKLFLLDTKSGNILQTIDSSENVFSKTVFFAKTSSGIIAADKTKALCWKDDGKLEWKAEFSPKKKWNYFFATDSGYIVFCGTNWVIEGYRMRQNMTKSSSFADCSPDFYKGFWNREENEIPVSSFLMGKTISDEDASKMFNLWQNDSEVDEKEACYLALLQAESSQIAASMSVKTANSKLAEENFYQKNFPYVSTVMQLDSINGTILYSDYIAKILSTTKDPSIFLLAIKCCQNMAFDYSGNMMKALEEGIKKASVGKNSTALIEISNAIYEICRVMGRPSFFEKGQELLSKLLYPQYELKVRENARNNLKKIADLKM